MALILSEWDCVRIGHDVGCGYIESFDRKGPKSWSGHCLASRLSAPPPMLGSCVNESVEVQNKRRAVQLSAAPKGNSSTTTKQVVAPGTHSPKRPLRTRSASWFYKDLATRLA